MRKIYILDLTLSINSANARSPKKVNYALTCSDEKKTRIHLKLCKYQRSFAGKIMYFGIYVKRLSYEHIFLFLLKRIYV